MRVTYVNASGQQVAEVLVLGRDHWDACLIGHSLLLHGAVGDAVDFHVSEISTTQAFPEEVLDDISCLASAASTKRRTATGV